MHGHDRMLQYFLCLELETFFAYLGRVCKGNQLMTKTENVYYPHCDLQCSRFNIRDAVLNVSAFYYGQG